MIRKTQPQKKHKRQVKHIKRTVKVLKFKFPVQYGIYLAAKGKVGGFIDTVSLRDLYALIHIDENTVKK